VHIATETYEKDLMANARRYAAKPGGEEDFDDQDLALYFSEPVEAPVAERAAAPDAGLDAELEAFFGEGVEDVEFDMDGDVVM
jgi:hypothetical protein